MSKAKRVAMTGMILLLISLGLVIGVDTKIIPDIEPIMTWVALGALAAGAALFFAAFTLSRP